MPNVTSLQQSLEKSVDAISTAMTSARLITGVGNPAQWSGKINSGFRILVRTALDSIVEKTSRTHELLYHVELHLMAQGHNPQGLHNAEVSAYKAMRKAKSLAKQWHTFEHKLYKPNAIVNKELRELMVKIQSLETTLADTKLHSVMALRSFDAVVPHLIA